MLMHPCYSLFAYWELCLYPATKVQSTEFFQVHLCQIKVWRAISSFYKCKNYQIRGFCSNSKILLQHRNGKTSLVFLTDLVQLFKWWLFFLRETLLHYKMCVLKEIKVKIVGFNPAVPNRQIVIFHHHSVDTSAKCKEFENTKCGLNPDNLYACQG